MSKKDDGKVGIGLVKMLVHRVNVLNNVLVSVLLCKESEIIGSGYGLTVSEMMVARKDKSVGAKEVSKLGISAGIIYHTVSKLNYSARLHALGRVNLCVYCIFTVCRRESVFV